MKHLFFFLLLFLSLAGFASAQSLDPTFQSTTLLNRSTTVQVLALAAQADGKSLVAGDFQAVGAELSNNVIRLNADRSRDLSFRTAPGANGPVSSLLALPDGKVLIAGSFGAYGGTATGPVARLLPSGELDATFQLSAALAGASVSVLAVQADGKMLVGGSASAALPGGLVRLLPGGALDTSFDVGAGAGPGGLVAALAVQPTDGRIVVGGRFTSFGGRVSQSVLRLLPDGSPDAGFAASSLPANAVIYGVALYANGNVLAGGNLVANGYGTPLLTRQLPSGAADPQFTATVNSGYNVRWVKVLPDGRALLGGSFNTVNSNGTAAINNRLGVARLLADGSLDPDFVPPRVHSGYLGAPYYLAALPLPDGQLLLGGLLTEANHNALCLLSATGVVDPAFDLDLKWRGTVSTATPLASGRLLLHGSYTSLNGQAVSGQFQRLHADGSLDQDMSLPHITLPSMPSYNTGGNSYGSLFPQFDGRVYAVVAGTYCRGSCIDNTQYKYYFLYRIAADNTVDASFTPVALGVTVAFGTVAASVQSVQTYANGDLLVAGQRITPVAPLLARYLPTGAPAPNFSAPQLPVGSRLDGALLLTDGAVLVSYHLASGESQLARMLPDGSLDPAFALGSSPALPAGSTFVASLALPAGQALVTGNFTSFGGVAAPSGVVRLTSTGAADPAFQPAASLAPLVPLAALPGGRLLARAGSGPATRLRRLLADGSADAAFTPVMLSVAGSPVASWSLVVQPTDGKPVLYGDFEAVSGQPRIGLARLAEGVLATRTGTAAVLGVYPNPAHGRATLALPAALAQPGTVQVLDQLGREVSRQLVPAQAREVSVVLDGLRPGLYVLRCGPATGRLVVE